MGHANRETLARAGQLVESGNYRLARELIRGINEESGLSPENLVEKKRILTITGVDPYLGGTIAITFAIWLFLFVKYVL